MKKDINEFLSQSINFTSIEVSKNLKNLILTAFREYKITSHIERLFYISFVCRQYLHNNTILEDFGFVGGSGDVFYGIDIIPQFKISKYRVDFFVSHGCGKDNPIKVIVECDGQAFHERTEKERRYEKKRDRDISNLGYKIYRFTGKEIMEDPAKIVDDVFSGLLYSCDSDY